LWRRWPYKKLQLKKYGFSQNHFEIEKIQQ